MSQNLLQSQFDTLEEPEDAICVDISQPMDAIVQQIYRLLMANG
jgi:gluconokinase